MKFLCYIFRVFIKVTGIIPFWVMIKPKRMHQNKANKSKVGLKGAILMSNHMGMFDYFTILVLWPFRKVRFLAGETIYRLKYRGFFSDLMGNIRIDRDHLNLNFIDESVKTLNKNGVVAIYPQGGFKKKGELGPFKSSIVYIALKSGAPIVPIYQDGHYGIFKRNHVSIGEKIYLKDYANTENPDKEEIIRLTKLLEKKMSELKKQQESYLKHKTYNLFSLRWFVLDFTKWTSFLADWFIFPKKKHYITTSNKN